MHSEDIIFCTKFGSKLVWSYLFQPILYDYL